jgi:3-isopropylmalate/(R)-2-methylmalate dehydratase large subunit
VTISGGLPRWSGGFDLALAVLDALGAEGPGAGAGPGTVVPSHTVLQLGGSALEALDLPGRLLLCEALASAGQLAVIAPDRATRTWLAARRPSRREAGPAVHVDPEAPPGAGGPGAGTRGPEGGAGATGGEPALAVSAGDAAPGARSGGIGGRPVDLADAAKGLRIDEAWLVGRLEDLRAAAEVLRDRNARRGLLLAVVAASQRTLLHAIEEGLAADLLRAGATLLPPGSRPAPLARGACRVTSAMSASNAPGGPEEVLAGPAVVAASAVAGRVVEPETMRRAHRRATRVH